MDNDPDKTIYDSSENLFPPEFFDKKDEGENPAAAPPRQLQKVSEEERRKYVESNKLSTAQRIECRLARIARNFDLVALAIFGLCTGTLGHIIGQGELALIAFFVLLSVFFLMVSWIAPKGTMAAGILDLIRDRTLLDKISEKIRETITGRK